MIKSPKGSIVSAAIACAALFGASANAQSVTVQFQGTVNYTSAVAGAYVGIGDTFAGSFTYDSETADADDANAVAGTYTNAIQSLSFSIGGLSFSKGVDSSPSFATDAVLITNDGFGMGLDTFIAIVPELSGTDVGTYSVSDFGFELQLADPTGTAYSTDSLPLSVSLAPFENTDPSFQPVLLLDLTQNGTKSTFAAASITSVSTVPVPASIWLLGSGVLGLLGLARKRGA